MTRYTVWHFSRTARLSRPAKQPGVAAIGTQRSRDTMRMEIWTRVLAAAEESRPTSVPIMASNTTGSMLWPYSQMEEYSRSEPREIMTTTRIPSPSLVTILMVAPIQLSEIMVKSRPKFLATRPPPAPWLCSVVENFSWPALVVHLHWLGITTMAVWTQTSALTITARS